MNTDKELQERSMLPIEYLLKYYDIELMEEFQITNSAASPFYFNMCGCLCNCRNEIVNEMLHTLLMEPQWFARQRKFHNLTEKLEG